jgi:transcriptional regulator with XRE-family HTH domain
LKRNIGVDGEEIKAALGRNIKKLRTHRRYSQAVLAEKADISIIYLSNIERGVKYPKPAVLAQIAEGLDVEVYELFKTNHMPKDMPKDGKKAIARLSREMTRKVNQTMEVVFGNYLK